MSKHIDLELALNELLRLYEEDVERYGVEIRCGLKTPETFDYRRAREALSDLPTIEIVFCEECKHAPYCEQFLVTTTFGDEISDGYEVYFCQLGERIDNE